MYMYGFGREFVSYFGNSTKQWDRFFTVILGLAVCGVIGIGWAIFFLIEWFIEHVHISLS